MITPRMYITGFLLLALLTTIGIQAMYISALHGDIKILESEKAALKGAEKQVESDINTTKITVKEKIIYREKQSAPIYKYITTYKGDANASDCDNNMSLLRSFTF